MAYMKQLVEHEGVMLEIEYSPEFPVASPPQGPEITSARVLDAEYRPTGPNLLHLLDKMYIEIVTGADLEASKFLGVVATELS
jgi:hypothetical protein